MQLYGLTPVFISILIIFIPMIMCSYPEQFKHNVNLEFMADNLYEAKLRWRTQLKKQIAEKAGGIRAMLAQ